MEQLLTKLTSPYTLKLLNLITDAWLCSLAGVLERSVVALAEVTNGANCFGMFAR